MQSNFITQLLNLKGIKVTKISHGNSFVKIYITTEPRKHTCPACGSKTSRIHDYREQTIKDLPFQFKHTYLVLRKRRYACSCGNKKSLGISCILVNPMMTINNCRSIVSVLGISLSNKDIIYLTIIILIVGKIDEITVTIIFIKNRSFERRQTIPKTNILFLIIILKFLIIFRITLYHNHLCNRNNLEDQYWL